MYRTTLEQLCRFPAVVAFSGIAPKLYGDAQPHLFVFTTLRNYDTGQNFYNKDGGVYRRPPGRLLPAGPVRRRPALPGRPACHVRRRGGEPALHPLAGSTTGSCYTIDITGDSPSDWGTYLFFGGPGGLTC